MASVVTTTANRVLNPDTGQTGDDFVDSFCLSARCEGHRVEQTRRVTDSARGIRNAVVVEQWSTVREIGRGGFGTVYLEQEKSGKLRAVKQVPKYAGRKKTVDHLREILAMAHFSKEEALFVNFEGWYQNESHLFLAMEYFPNGDLSQVITQPLPEEHVQTVSRQLVEAVDFMHRNNFTHRDIKPSNVFVVSNFPEWWVKLGDFGVSKRVRDESTFLHTSIESDYTAPEITGHIEVDAAEKGYTNAVDMWSLGCLVHWLHTGTLPLSKQNLLRYCLGKIPLPTHALKEYMVSSKAHEFVNRLLKPAPSDRMTAVQALGHPWFEETLDVPSQNSVDDTTHSSNKSQSEVSGPKRARPRSEDSDAEPPAKKKKLASNGRPQKRKRSGPSFPDIDYTPGLKWPVGIAIESVEVFLCPAAARKISRASVSIEASPRAHRDSNIMDALPKAIFNSRIHYSQLDLRMVLFSTSVLKLRVREEPEGAVMKELESGSFDIEADSLFSGSSLSSKGSRRSLFRNDDTLRVFILWRVVDASISEVAT